MELNYKEQIQDERPYWKVIVSLAFSLLATVLFLYIGFRFVLFFMPFVIGWLLSAIASPLVNWLEKRVKIMKKLGSVLIIIGVLAALIFLFYFAGSRLWHEMKSLLENLPAMYEDIERGLDEIGNNMAGFFAMLPTGIQNGWHALVNNLDQTAGELISKISEPTISVAGRAAKGIPSMLIATIVTIISSYFFIAEREEVLVWAKKAAPDPIVKRMTMVMDNLKYAAGGYFKAQLKIMAVVFIILTVGFLILNVHFSFVFALLIAFLDFLPFFGTGTALIPWAAYKFMVGDYKMMIGLIILYGVTQLVRQLIQPKLVGDSMGLNPLVTLVLLYMGYKTGGVFGMIFAVPVGLIVMNLYKAGAFDYILVDVKILIEGIMGLRNQNE